MGRVLAIALGILCGIGVFTLPFLIIGMHALARKRLGRLAELLGGSCDIGMRARFSVDGLFCTAALDGKKGDLRPRVELHVDAGAAVEKPLNVSLRRKTWLDWLGDAAKINRRVRSGDAVFDRHVHVDTEEPDALGPMLSNSAVREAAMTVVRLGWRAEVGDGSRAKRVGAGAAAMSPERVTAVLRAFVIVAAALPSATSTRARGSAAGCAFAAAAVATPFLAPLAFFHSSSAFRPVDDGIYGIVAAVWLVLTFAAAVVLAARVRGKTNSIYKIAGTLAWVAITIPPSLSVELVLGANALLDGTTARIHRSILRSHSGHGDPLTIQVEGLSRGDANLSIQVRAQEPHADGQAVTLEVGRGSLGFRWIRNVTRR